MSELLWINRDRLLRGDRVREVRRIYLPSEEVQQDRQLTQMRDQLMRKRTQTLNQIHNILRRHNLEWDRPSHTVDRQENGQMAAQHGLVVDPGKAGRSSTAWTKQIVPPPALAGIGFPRPVFLCLHYFDDSGCTNIVGTILFPVVALWCRPR